MKATKKDKEAIVKEDERTAAESLNKEISNVEEESTENDDQVTASESCSVWQTND